MFGRWKKKADPERQFEESINAAIRKARKDGVSQSAICRVLAGHGDSLRRLIDLEIERRKYGDPVYLDASQ